MKTIQAVITASLMLAPISMRSQDLPAYENIVNTQSPFYYNTLNNSLSPTVGTGTFSATAGSTFTSDYFGNANNAVSFTSSADQLSYATGNNIINGSGAANSIGSLSLLLYTPNTSLAGTTGQYIFSDGDVAGANGNLFALLVSGGNFQLKAGNKTIALPAATGGQWYYFGATWNFSGINSSPYGVTWYLGVAGQPDSSLLTGFIQRGGTGNISSTSILGDGGAFVLSGHQAGGTGGWQVSGFPGGVDELATWSTQLTPAQFTSQFDALQPVPEPSTGMMYGMCGFLVLVWKHSFGRSRAIREV